MKKYNENKDEINRKRREKRKLQKEQMKNIQSSLVI